MHQSSDHRSTVTRLLHDQFDGKPWDYINVVMTVRAVVGNNKLGFQPLHSFPSELSSDLLRRSNIKLKLASNSTCHNMTIYRCISVDNLTMWSVNAGLLENSPEYLLLQCKRGGQNNRNTLPSNVTPCFVQQLPTLLPFSFIYLFRNLYSCLINAFSRISLFINDKVTIKWCYNNCNCNIY